MEMSKKSQKRSSREEDFFLVQKALCGDEVAFTKIWEKYRKPVEYQIRKIVSDHNIVQDILMETFEKAFMNLYKFRPDYQLSAWLVRIAINHSLDYCRKIQRNPVVRIDEGFTSEEDDRPLIQLIDNNKMPDQALEMLQDIETIQALLKHLPETSGKVIRMKFLDDLSYEEIADELRVSVKKARCLMRRAKKQLLVVIPTLIRTDIEIRSH